MMEERVREQYKYTFNIFISISFREVRRKEVTNVVHTNARMRADFYLSTYFFALVYNLF